MSSYVIVGNGAAGVTAAETIRQQDPGGNITIVSAEPYPMYSRPGLAYVLTNDIPNQQIFARSREWYTHFRIQFVNGRAIKLDPIHQKLFLASGRTLGYDRLLIATGSKATTPPYPGAELEGVVYLDTLDGTKKLMQQARRGRRAVVIGGGITAMELAEGLARQGMKTHYFLRGGRLWGRVFNDTESQLLAKKIGADGVQIHYHTEISQILGNRRGKVRGVRLADGREFKCNLVGVAIGVRPQLEMVRGTAVETDRGILVNEYLQTNVPHVFAAGDCAQVYDRWSEQFMLDILWPSAVAEGHAAGLSMTGRGVPYRKGTPFNACLLFGLHITLMGQINPQHDGNGETAVIQHLSRGSSEVWHTFRRHYASAWAEDGDNTMRLVIDGDYLTGALVIGEQRLADPLRHIIENRVNIAHLQPRLQAGGPILRQSLTQFWAEQSAMVTG